MAERDTRLPARLRLALGAAIAALLVALGATEPWHELELKGFDALSVATAPNASSFPITVVGIDEQSFQQLARQWPWPRSIHARLVDALTQGGAMVIAFDVQFSEADRGGPAEDAALAAAIGRHGNVVLASDLVYVESAHARQWLRVDPLDRFRQAGGVSGFARIELDRDLVARRMPRESDAFWRQIARAVARVHPEVQVSEPQPGAMIRYAGPILTFPFVSYYQALDPASLPPDAFRDQVVIVGRHVQASPEAGAAQSDVFSTPFTMRTGWFTPGAEIHAHILETALRGDAIYPVPFAWNAMLIVAVVLLAVFAFGIWRPLRGAAVGGVMVAALVALDWLLFVRYNRWLPVGAAVTAVGAVYLAFGAAAFLVVQHRRSQLRRAFALYVSPEVVDHVMERPDRLGLGGERREITVLFTDLQGFTNLSEQLGAEQVARVLNMHFTDATRIVKGHRGTVNRFIGDSVMAMWGAPLDDPQQARNAFLAACEMQREMERLCERLAGEGLPRLRMRIGIHSCTAVVGNLGSEDRFDYTAIGDGVNLAARLEGVNKLYGTGVLLSAATVERMGGAAEVRAVDCVVVKGKSEAVEIFTPCDDPEVIEASARALAAFRAGAWDASEALWRQLVARDPADGVARAHLERIAAFRAAPPEPGWTGAVELEKL